MKTTTDSILRTLRVFENLRDRLDVVVYPPAWSSILEEPPELFAIVNNTTFLRSKPDALVEAVDDADTLAKLLPVLNKRTQRDLQWVRI